MDKITGDAVWNVLPGRMLVLHTLWRWERIPNIETAPFDYFAEEIQEAISSSLYSDDPEDALRLNRDDVRVPAICQRIAAKPRAPLFSTRTPSRSQVHYGAARELRPVTVRNRADRDADDGALPDSAFWPASILPNGDDAWGMCGEHLVMPDERRIEVVFDPGEIDVHPVCTAGNWLDLIRRFPRQTSAGLLAPDWPAVAAVYDAVHLSDAGLLLAHPPISETPDDWVGVAHWSAASTCWLRIPPSMRLTE